MCLPDSKASYALLSVVSLELSCSGEEETGKSTGNLALHPACKEEASRRAICLCY